MGLTQEKNQALSQVHSTHTHTHTHNYQTTRTQAYTIHTDAHTYEQRYSYRNPQAHRQIHCQVQVSTLTSAQHWDLRHFFETVAEILSFSAGDLVSKQMEEISVASGFLQTFMFLNQLQINESKDNVLITNERAETKSPSFWPISCCPLRSQRDWSPRRWYPRCQGCPRLPSSGTLLQLRQRIC